MVNIQPLNISMCVSSFRAHSHSEASWAHWRVRSAFSSAPRCGCAETTSDVCLSRSSRPQSQPVITPLTFTDLKNTHNMLWNAPSASTTPVYYHAGAEAFSTWKETQIVISLRQEILGQLNCCWNLIAEMAGRDGLWKPLQSVRRDRINAEWSKSVYNGH